MEFDRLDTTTETVSQGTMIYRRLWIVLGDSIKLFYNLMIVIWSKCYLNILCHLPNKESTTKKVTILPIPQKNHNALLGILSNVFFSCFYNSMNLFFEASNSFYVTLSLFYSCSLFSLKLVIFYFYSSYLRVLVMYPWSTLYWALTRSSYPSSSSIRLR